MKNLKEKREIAGMSKLKLAMGSQVSRYRITLAEVYGEPLTPTEEAAISRCLLAEAQRHAALASRIQHELEAIAV